MMSRPENSKSPKGSETSGLVSRVSHTMENSSAMRVSMASARPVMRADSRCAGGSRLTRIEMKMMLSMPSTISSADSVMNAIHAWGSVTSSIKAQSSRKLVDGIFMNRREQVLGFQPAGQCDGAGDPDRGIRAGDDADEQRLGKPAQRLTTQQQQR